MSRIDVAPAGDRATHALVVGVGSYPYCGAGAQLPKARLVRDLSSPPISAHGLVDWLIEHAGDFDAPLASIRLLSDPVAGSPHAVTPPTFANVEQAMMAWQAEGRPDDVLLLYWCGHGLLTQHRERLLLCQDVGKDGRFWRYVVDSRADATKAKASPAKTQLWLVDACQEAAEDLGLAGPNGQSTLPDVTTNALAAMKGKDFGIVLSSSEFQVAEATPGEESHFCRALKEALEWRAFVPHESDGWRVRTTDLVAPINDIFAERQQRQQCMPVDGMGRHSVLWRDSPPVIPSTFVCDPAVLQAEVTLAVDREVLGAGRTPLAAQPGPSPDPWLLDVPAGIVYLSGRHQARGERLRMLTIEPNRRRGELPW